LEIYDTTRNPFLKRLPWLGGGFLVWNAGPPPSQSNSQQESEGRIFLSKAAPPTSFPFPPVCPSLQYFLPPPPRKKVPLFFCIPIECSSSSASFPSTGQTFLWDDPPPVPLFGPLPCGVLTLSGVPSSPSHVFPDLPSSW